MSHVRAALMSRLLPGTFFLLFAMLGVMRAQAENPLEWARVLVSAAFVALMGYLYFVRRPRKGERSSVGGAVVALAGTSAPMMLTIAPLHEQELLLAVGTAVTTVGLAFSVFALAALGRCFGIFPEARGLVTHGPYGWVRHPLYLGEYVAAAGILISVISPLALALYAGLVALQVWRALNEERVLSQAFPEYAEYARRTPRFVPSLRSRRAVPGLERAA